MDISVNQASAVLREATRETIRKRSMWFLVQGALLVVAGIVAMVAPLFASTFFIVFLGWLLVIAGIGQGIGLIGATQVHYFWLQLISAVLANKLPGPGVVYMGQTLKFKAPVRIGDTVTATVTVREVMVGKRRCVLDAVCTVGGKTVIEGESTMYCTTNALA